MAFFKRLFRFTSRSSGDIRADVGDEIAFHLEMRTRELVERGWTPEAARREARQQFGSVDTTADYCRRLDEDREQGTRARRRFDELRQDAVYGGRMLRRHPALSAVAILTMGLGIGASTLVYSVFHAALLAPLPYASAERLMVVRLSLPDYKDLRESTSLFEDSGVFASNLFTIGDDQVLAGVVSPGFFRTLGVAPALGRVFDENDGGAPLMVLGHGMWKRRFGGDPQIVGRTVRLSNTVYTITGVMPPNFQFPTRAFEFWSNFEATLAIVPQQAQNRSLRIFQAVGRLRESLPPSQAQAELTALADRLAATYPDTNASVAMTLVSVRERLVGNVRGALRLALGAVACLLFIACVNVANLTLTRMTARTQELAVRAALGAGRGRIARQLLTESLLIASLGGALGLALARWGLLALPALVGDRIPRTDDVALDLPVLAVAAGAILVAGLLVAAVPVLQLSINGIEPALKGGGRSDGDMRAGARLRSALVVTQIAVAVIVLSGALLLTRSLVRLLNADAGFVVSNLLTFNLQLVDAAEPAARVALATRTLDAIAALPGIEAVGGATGLAPRTAQRSTTFEVEGAGEVEVDSRRGYFIASTPDYFRALGTRVLAGREFAASDTAAAPLVVVVSETLARRFFPGGGAIGRRLRLINPEYPDDVAHDRRRGCRREVSRARRRRSAGRLHTLRADAVPLALRPGPDAWRSVGGDSAGPEGGEDGEPGPGHGESAADGGAGGGVGGYPALHGDAHRHLCLAGDGAGDDRAARRRRVRRRAADARDCDPPRARRVARLGAMAGDSRRDAPRGRRRRPRARRRRRHGRRPAGDALRHRADQSGRARARRRRPAVRRGGGKRDPGRARDSRATGRGAATVLDRANRVGPGRPTSPRRLTARATIALVAT